MTAWMALKSDAGISAALFALVAALLPAHFFHQGATALVIDPPHISRPSAVQSYVVQRAHVGSCAGLRGQVSLRCFWFDTETGDSFQMGSLSESQVRILKAVEPKLPGETLTVGIWGADRSHVMSLALGNQSLVDYSDRRESLVRASMIKFAVGGVSLVAIIGVFGWRLANLVSKSTMETA